LANTEKRPFTSIVSYPERGVGGNNKYRGNCSPELIKDLISHFGLKEICDYMCGSNTTQHAAEAMGINSKVYDLHSGFDLLNHDIPERSNFTFWHPLSLVSDSMNCQIIPIYLSIFSRRNIRLS